jgi:hypothetical protein
MAPIRVWAVLAILYSAFFSWYTSFSGPLSGEEIAHYVDVLQTDGERDPARIALWLGFMENDTGDDFAMFNALDLRETPLPMDGVPADESSQAVMQRYARPFMAEAFKSAAHPVLLGSAAAGTLDLWGIEGAEQWSNAGVVRYRSRRDLMEQAVHTLGADIHGYKIAALEKTIAYPLDPWFHLGDPRLVLALVLGVIGFALQARSAGRKAAQAGE